MASMASGSTSAGLQSSSTSSSSASLSASCACAKTSSTVSAPVLLAADDPPRERHHQVVAVVRKCGEPVLRRLPLYGERALQLAGHQLEGVGLQRAAAGHEHDPDRPGPADAPGSLRCLPHALARTLIRGGDARIRLTHPGCGVIPRALAPSVVPLPSLHAASVQEWPYLPPGPEQSPPGIDAPAPSTEPQPPGPAA